MIKLVYILPLVMMGGQLAYATNESSYKFGYESGKVMWHTCVNPDADCETAVPACTDHQVSYINGVANIEPPPDNQTACQDGFIHAWNHMCAIKTKGYDEVQCPYSGVGLTN
jgi:hypothetical protein